MRVDDNRPSASEQAKNDDKKRQSLKQRDNASQSRLSQQAGRAAQTRETRTAFDNVLDNLMQETLQSKPEQSSSKFESQFKEKVQEKEKPKEKTESHREKDSESKVKSSENTEGQKNIKDLSSRQQVHAKHDSREGGSGGGNQGGGEQKGEGGNKQFSGGGRQFASSKGELSPTALGQGVKMDSLAQAEKSQMSSRGSQIPKQILDQIIQVIKVGMGKDDQKELHLDLSQKVFRGLSLKLSSKNGKVDVSFITADPHVRRLFESEKQNISEALKEKGVLLSQMRVLYTG